MDLTRAVERALGIRLEGARFDPQVEEPAHPDVRLSPTFDTHFELLWFLIPMRVFRPLVRGHFRRRIPWEVEKNLSRVAGQWADAVAPRSTVFSGPRSRSLPASNPGYADRWSMKQPIPGGPRCGPTRSRKGSSGRPTAAC